MRKHLQDLKGEYNCRLGVWSAGIPGDVYCLRYCYDWIEAACSWTLLSEVSDFLAPVFSAMVQEAGLRPCGNLETPKLLCNIAVPSLTKAGKRWSHLAPMGIPRWIRAYDNGGMSNKFSCNRCHRFFDEDHTEHVCTCGGRLRDVSDTGSGDRYTVLYTGRMAPERSPGRVEYPYRAMSEHPSHPQGIGIYGASPNQPLDANHGTWGGVSLYKTNHLGKRIKYDDLPEDVRRCVWQDYTEIWKLP